MKIKIIIILLTLSSLGFMYVLLNTSFIYVPNNSVLKKEIVSNETNINDDYKINSGSILKQEDIKRQKNDLTSSKISDSIENEELILEEESEKKLILVEKEIFGDYIDTNIEQTSNILENYFAYKKYRIIEIPSIEDIKYELAQGHPIIAPFAGQMLKNPHFVGDGPRYHMLVIVGYDENNFITNDVGTYMGENYVYSYDTIMNALHDLVPNGEGDIATGKKKILVLE